MIMYKLSKDPITQREDRIIIKVLGNNSFLNIPFDEENKDYQEYLEWAKTNTAEKADGLSWDDIRSKRDSILSSTDWTMTTGATVDQAQWAAYRQNLRDLPQTYKDKTPDDVVWPTQPSTAGPNS